MDLFKNIKPNTTILTPNRRLSASLLKKYSAWQIAREQTCWQTLDILPLYPSWLERMWKTYSARDLTDNTILLTTSQEQILWEKILRDAPENESLLKISDTAKLAKSAWETLKRWQVNLTDPTLKLTEDSRAFLQWANQFEKLCHKNNWLDPNSLADAVIEKIQQNIIQPPAHIILIGFTEIAPQYQHLLKICAQHGSDIQHHEQPLLNQTTHSIGLTDSDTEIRTMARWAKSLSETANSIGCIIPSLETLREETIQIFSDVFGDTEFNISAGKSLTTYPIIRDALLLLNLNAKSISATTLSSILRSPFIGEAERERYKRAFYDSRLRHSNITTTTLDQLIKRGQVSTHATSQRGQVLTIDMHINVNSQDLTPLGRGVSRDLTPFDQTPPLLAKRIKSFIDHTADIKKLPISEWVKIFVELLTQLGWPGERSLNSHEYQVVQNCWLPLLNEYAAFDAILEPQNYSSALHYLTCLASSKVFQPESPETSVQILGLLEAAEIPFEHAWIMGLDDTTWPSRPKPNPFIPLRMQKSLQMPNASAERELIYCQQLTKQLQHSTAHVIFSYPLQKEDAELRPSALLKNIKHKELNQLTLSSFISPGEKIYQTTSTEWIQDDIAPAILSVDEVTGGVNIFKSQAICPFKAFAEIRLHARKMEETTIGLRKLDRGNMVHKALEYIWRELHDSTTLIMKPDDELHDLIHRSAELAITEIVASNHAGSTRYLELELQRLKKLLWEWLAIEKQRPAFKVVALEHEITARIGNITANFRVDRIDELMTETSVAKQLIIDYKTSKEIDKKDWFGDRLAEPQLPIYCIANPDDTIGIAFAKLNPHKMEMQGTSQIPVNMQAIIPLANIKQADATLWHEQTQIWRNNLVKLADDFYHGVAHVDPKDANQSCRLCGLQPLCRIHEITDVEEAQDE